PTTALRTSASTRSLTRCASDTGSDEMTGEGARVSTIGVNSSAGGTPAARHYASNGRPGVRFEARRHRTEDLRRLPGPGLPILSPDPRGAVFPTLPRS